jgi:hypothetical protein
MSLEVIVALNEEIGREAAAENLQPFVPNPANVERWTPFSFPNLGYYVPNGWAKAETWFVDKSGHGYESEPALTHRRFRRLLRGYVEDHPNHGFAIVEEGPFQVVIAAFRPEPTDELRSAA